MAIDIKKLFDTDVNTDTKSRNALLKALKDNAETQFDYLKFKHSVLSLIDMGLDTEKAYKSAFATASTMGLSKSNLLTSAKKYSGVLSKEKRHFTEALNNQITGRVEKKKAELGKYEQRLSNNKSKIEELLKQNELLEQKIDQVKQDLAGNNNKLKETNDNFQVALDEINKSILTDIGYIEDYL